MLIFAAILLVLLNLYGCAVSQERTAQFCYPRNPDSYQFGTMEDVITWETRSFPAPASDAEYLLQLYLEGPVTETLTNPFPQGTKLLTCHLRDKSLTISLSSEFSALEGTRLTIASACLTETCFRITDAESLVLVCGSQRYTYTRESFLYLDDSAFPAQ